MISKYKKQWQQETIKLNNIINNYVLDIGSVNAFQSQFHEQSFPALKDVNQSSVI
jgi:hypothetical protein